MGDTMNSEKTALAYGERLDSIEYRLREVEISLLHMRSDIVELYSSREKRSTIALPRSPQTTGTQYARLPGVVERVGRLEVESQDVRERLAKLETHEGRLFDLEAEVVELQTELVELHRTIRGHQGSSE